MPSNESLRKQCAKLCLDTIIHQSITEVARSPGVQQAFLRLLITSGNPTTSAINQQCCNNLHDARFGRGRHRYL
jgi:hypothetical protein